jgi:transposase
MSLRPTLCRDVPASTATVAHAAFPRGNPYLLLRDQLGTIFTDAQFVPLFAPCGQRRNARGGWRW